MLRTQRVRLGQGADDLPAHLTELQVRGVTIKLHRAGHGPTVLFLHGAGGVPQWLPFFDALAERCQLLVPEHPGFGGSDDPQWIHSMSDPCAVSISSSSKRRVWTRST